MPSIFSRFNLLRKIFPSRKLIDPTGRDLSQDKAHSLFQSLEYGYYDKEMKFPQDRSELYRELEVMDEDDLCSSVLDLYADSVTQSEVDSGSVIWPVSDNTVITQILLELFERIEIDDRAFAIVRQMCKYGDDFEMIMTSVEKGIESLTWMQPQDIERLEDRYRNLQGFTITTATKPEEGQLKPWDILHWRLRSDGSSAKYGSSLLKKSIRSWKRVRMAEDSSIIYRLKASPGRDVWTVEVGDMSLTEALRMVRRVKQSIREQRLFNGEGDLRTDVNPISVDESFFIPTRNGTAIIGYDRKQGEAASQDVTDLVYFIKRFYGNLSVPKEYFGFDDSGGLFDHSQSLMQKDVRFARSCKRIQRAFCKGLVRLCQIQLAYKGIDVKSLEHDFRLVMVPISFLDEQQRTELMNMRLEFMDKIISFGVNLDKQEWFSYILRDVAKLPPVLADKLSREVPGAEGKEELSGEQKEQLKKMVDGSRSMDNLLESLGSYRSRTTPRENLPGKMEETVSK